MTPDAWLQRHPYLRDLAQWSSQVDAALSRVPRADVPIPAFEDHAEEFRAGVFLLQSSTVHVDLEPAGAMTAALVRNLVTDPLGGRPGDDVRKLDGELRGDPDAFRRIAGWLLGDDGWAPASPGLLRYLGWTAAARYLRPLVAAFSVGQ